MRSAGIGFLVLFFTLCGGCVSPRDGRASSRISCSAELLNARRDHIVAKVLSVAEGVVPQFRGSPTNEWRKAICREELIGTWQGIRRFESHRFDYNVADDSLVRKGQVASSTSDYEIDLRSDGRCSWRTIHQSQAGKGLIKDDTSGMWSLTTDGLKIAWTSGKESSYEVYFTPAGQMAIRAILPPTVGSRSHFYWERLEDDNGILRSTLSIRGTLWSVFFASPIVVTCVDEQDRGKFSRQIQLGKLESSDRTQAKADDVVRHLIDSKRKELENLKKAGIIDEAEFAAEVKKLEGAGK